MKVKIGLVVAMIIPAVMIASCSAPPESPSEPGLPNPPGYIDMRADYDDFQEENHITTDINISVSGTLEVSLYSNPTTGYQWTENADISDTTVISQAEHNYVSPQDSEEPVVGAGGKDVWTFNVLKKGTATITMVYSRPWESDSSDNWTYTLNVTVK